MSLLLLLYLLIDHHVDHAVFLITIGAACV
jgi:hypothetical protein